MGFDVKITTFSRILDLVAPFSCRGCGRLGSLLCERCKKYNMQRIVKICPRCRKSQKKCSCMEKIYAVSYRDGVMLKLTEDYKYKSIRKTAEVLAELMSAAIPKKEVGTARRNTVMISTMGRSTQSFRFSLRFSILRICICKKVVALRRKRLQIYVQTERKANQNH